MSAIFILHFSISIDQSSLSTTPLNFVPFGLRVKTDARQIPLGGLCAFASDPRALSSDTYLVTNPRSSPPNFRDLPCHSVAPNSVPQFRVFRVFRGHPTRANHPPNSVIFRVIPWPQSSPPFVSFVSFVVIRRAPISGVESRHEAYQEAPPSPHCHACFAADRNYESKIRVPKRPGRVKSNPANLREPKCQPLA